MTGKRKPAKSPGSKRRQGPRAIESAELQLRENKALALKEQGLTYTQIAQEIGYANAAGAWKAVARALGRERADRVETIRAYELRRFERRDRKLWAIFLNPKSTPELVLKAHEGLNQTSDRRARILGLVRAPVELKLDQAIEAFQQEMLDVVRSLVPAETFDRIATALARIGGVGGSGEGEDEASAGEPAGSEPVH